MFPREWNNDSTGNFTLKSLNIKLWFTIYSFCVETTTIHFLVPNSTKNHQKCVIWSIASTCKKNFQYKTIGGEILVPRYRKLQLSLLQSIVGVAVIAMFSGTFHCGCGCNRHVQRNILAQEPSLNSTVLLRYGLKTRMKFIESCTIFTTETWQNILPYLDH